MGNIKEIKKEWYSFKKVAKIESHLCLQVLRERAVLLETTYRCHSVASQQWGPFVEKCRPFQTTNQQEGKQQVVYPNGSPPCPPAHCTGPQREKKPDPCVQPSGSVSQDRQGGREEHMRWRKNLEGQQISKLNPANISMLMFLSTTSPSIPVFFVFIYFLLDFSWKKFYSFCALASILLVLSFHLSFPSLLSYVLSKHTKEKTFYKFILVFTSNIIMYWYITDYIYFLDN